MADLPAFLRQHIIPHGTNFQDVIGLGCRFCLIPSEMRLPTSSLKNCDSSSCRPQRRATYRLLTTNELLFLSV
jgi:hypothetical protein